ncbi:MAG: site-2 protease family protein [Deltaproteobacteria bacterium]|nr:site-2 protease family protein [Deltaproteobacteria bacterium]MBW2418018.1 site-2 protease family protein [Deltaproteobacteria bacterium]
MAHSDPPGSPDSTHRAGVFGGASWRLGTVSGIEITVDHTWVLIFGLVTVSLGTRLGAAHAEDWSPGVVWATALVASLLFFTSIVLHELGHSLVAQRVGVRVRSITLFVFGGLARLESEPRRPRDEILIALAGPLVSLVLAAAFSGIAGLFAGLAGDASGAPEVVAEASTWLARINLIVAIFNVVPGFPLDGGRVLRGVVWAATGSFARATRVAAASGSLFAYTLIGLGIFSVLFGRQLLGGLWLVFIGWFLLSAARATVGQMLIEQILEQVRVAHVLERNERAWVQGLARVGELVTRGVMQHGLRTFFVVDEREQLRGIVTLHELSQVSEDERSQTRVEEIMVPAEALATTSPDESCWDAFQRLSEWNVNQLPVLADGRLLGALTRERLLAVVQARLTLRT